MALVRGSPGRSRRVGIPRQVDRTIDNSPRKRKIQSGAEENVFQPEKRPPCFRASRGS